MHEANHTPDILPTSRTLVRSTLIAVAVAAVLLVTVVLPAEYGVDPMGVGRVLGLTQMGQIKMQLAREAEEGAALEATLATGKPDPRLAAAEGQPKQWRDSMTVTLAPGEGVELKLSMTKDQKATYEWRADSADVGYNAHGEPPNPPKGFSHSYGRGMSRGEQGELVAAFDGSHGWFWRNSSEKPVRITLSTSGQYQELKRM